MVRDIRRAADLGFMARHQHAIACHDQVRFDIVRTLLDGALIARKRVLGPLTARAAVSDDDYFVRMFLWQVAPDLKVHASLAYAHSRGSP